MKSALALLTFTSAAGVLGWMLLMPNALQSEIEARTGFPVKAGSLAVNPFGLSVTGTNLEIGNPSAYGGGAPMLEIASLEAKASLPSLGRGEIWIYELEMRISKATLVVDEGGHLNLDAFARRLFAGKVEGKQMPFFAEKVHLVVDELVFVDNSRLIPSSRNVRALLDVELSDLEDSEAIFGPLRELARSVGSLPIQ